MMQKQTRLYLQKAGILAAVYVVLRFLLPAALPFFLAWLTVAGFNSARHQIRMRLLPFSAGCLFLAGLAAFVLLGLSAWLLYQPLLDLLPVWQEGFHMLHQELDWLASSLSGRLVIMVPSVFSWLFGIFLYVISVILFARDWVSFRELLKKLPFASPVSRAGKRVSSALKNWAHVQVRIMFIVALECAVGFWLLRIPGADYGPCSSDSWMLFLCSAPGLSFSPGSFLSSCRKTGHLPCGFFCSMESPGLPGKFWSPGS